MSGRFLLDTNVVIALFASDATVRQRLADADEVYVASIVLGELYYGARHSARPDENAARIDAFAAGSAVVGCDAAAARLYGEVKATLRAKG